MALTTHDVTPVGLCMATEDMFDKKRFLANFCDFILLRSDDSMLKTKIRDFKSDLNARELEDKFLEGYKAVIINNIDKIIALVASRYVQTNLKMSQSVITNAKNIMRQVLAAGSFDDIGVLEATFKTEVSLPIYSLFNESMKR